MFCKYSKTRSDYKTKINLKNAKEDLKNFGFYAHDNTLRKSGQLLIFM